MDFTENIVRAVRWLLSNQFSAAHPDRSLAGSFFELGFRKIAHWASDNELDVVQRNIATTIGMHGLTDYVNVCRSADKKKQFPLQWAEICSTT